MEREITDGVATRGTIHLQAFDVERCRETFPDWDEMSKDERFRWLSVLDPDWSTRTTNTTTTGLQSVVATAIDPNANSREQANYLALGTDNTSPSSSNTALNNEVFRSGVSDSSVSGNTLSTSTFIDSSEANGNTLVELGLTTGDTDEAWTLLNHSTYSSLTKDNTIVVTFNVDLTFNVA